MLIGKYWGEANQRWFWATGKDFDDLRCALETDLMEYGENYDNYNPARIEIWQATKMMVVAKYEIKAAD